LARKCNESFRRICYHVFSQTTIPPEIIGLTQSASAEILSLHSNVDLDATIPHALEEVDEAAPAEPYGIVIKEGECEWSSDLEVDKIESVTLF